VTHDVLKANEVWSAYESAGEVLKEKRLALARHRADLIAPYEAAVAQHKADVVQAVEAGTMPPPVPELPDLRHVAEAEALVLAKERAHRERRDAVLGEISGDVQSALLDRESASNARLAQVAPEVRRLLAQRVADLSLFAQVLGAEDRELGLAVHPSRFERVATDVTVDSLLSGAEADASMFRLSDLPRPISHVVQRDDGRDDGIRQIQPKRLGLSGRGFGGTR